MSYVNPIWLEGQRRRWQRHDWQRFIRHDAHRFMTPAGIAEEQRAAEAEKTARRKAEAAAAAEQDAFEREVLALRHDFAKLKLEYELRRFQQKYSPDQPRVPAGSPEGGQWTSDGEQSSTSNSFTDPFPNPIGPGIRQANVIPICIVGSNMITNNHSWWADYVCADGFTFRRFGYGGRVPGFSRDPRR